MSKLYKVETYLPKEALVIASCVMDELNEQKKEENK